MSDIDVFFEKNELVPAVIFDINTETVLMLAYMNRESLQKTLDTGFTWFWSRSRQEYWNKGETSGHFQKVISIFGDCDNDTLLVNVEQIGVACHTGNYSCFFNEIKRNCSTMEWTEVNIFTTTEGIDPVCGCLLNLGINGFVVKDAKDFEEFLADKSGNWDYIDDDLMDLKNCETCVTVYLPVNSQGAANLFRLRYEMLKLRGGDDDKLFGRLDVEFSNVKEEDWANNWKQYFKPFCIGERLVIKPSWEEFPKTDDKIILELDPASSFGTGQHNTTQLCLLLLEKYLQLGYKVLDLGCGSGILSIAAVLLGAQSSVAVDIEENSVKTAAENAEKNNILKNQYTALCGNIMQSPELVEKIGINFDIIVANIVADVLIGMSDLFPKFIKIDGILIMSGIISERKDEVILEVEKVGFKLVEAVENDGWVAICMKKA